MSAKQPPGASDSVTSPTAIEPPPPVTSSQTDATGATVLRPLLPRKEPVLYDADTVMGRYQLMCSGNLEEVEPGCSALDCSHSVAGAVESCAGLDCSACCVSVAAHVGRAVRAAAKGGNPAK